MTHICIGKLTIIGSNDSSLSGWCQVIIWTDVGILWIRTLGTTFTEILSKIHTFSLKKMHLKMASVKWWQFCLSLNVLSLHEHDKDNRIFCAKKAIIISAADALATWGARISVDKILSINYRLSIPSVWILPHPQFHFFKELWNPPSKTELSKYSFIGNKEPVNI